jgi:CRP/FNR family transcriptional regulator, cyclic AMP receptor protein
MSDAALVNGLRQVKLLAGLPPDHLDRVAKICRWREVPAGAEIVGHLDASSDVYFLVAGRARVIIHSPQGRSIILSDVSAGHAFGELSAIDGKPRSASVTAVTACTIAVIRAAEFIRLVESHATLAMAVIRSMGAVIRQLDERVVEFSVLSVPGRIQAELLRFGSEHAADSDTVVLSPSPTLADLADRISTHREAVSREMSRLAQMGILKREGNDLRITSLKRLADLVALAKGD